MQTTGARCVLLLSALVLSAAGTAHGQATVPLAAINGEWEGTLVLDNSQPRVSLVFALTDSAFAGMVYADGKEWGKMERGTMSHDTVHFNIDRFDFTGVVQGRKMKLALVVWNGSTRNLVLTRKPDMPPVPGSAPSALRDTSGRMQKRQE